MHTQYDAIWINAHIVTCDENNNVINKGALAVKDGFISWLGAMQDLTIPPAQLADKVYDVSGLSITPGLIDCHTHLIYAGDRAREFELRLQGVSYETIAQQGGGIQYTVSETRAVSEEALLEQSLLRARALFASGVTTLEIKSGYGLDLATELKMLRVAKRIEAILPITIKKTFLGAHALPPEYKGRPNEYIELVCQEMIPKVAEEKLADAVDVFCENIAFDLAQSELVFQAAKKYGLRVKCHAEQLSNTNSATLAAKYHALSVDHLEYVSNAGIEAMARSGTVAVLLPGAFYFLREKTKPPVHLLRENKIPIAIASDCNPGTSPVLSLQIILNMACTLFGLTPEEALTGVTQHAARGLGIEKTHGTLTVGKVADLAIWKVTHPAELAYYLGGNPLRSLVKRGVEATFK